MTDDDDQDRAFTEAAEHLVCAIEAFQEAGLTNDEIRAELEARLS